MQEWGERMADRGRANAHLACQRRVGKALGAAVEEHEKRAPEMEHVLRRTRLQQQNDGKIMLAAPTERASHRSAVQYRRQIEKYTYFFTI